MTKNCIKFSTAGGFRELVYIANGSFRKPVNQRRAVFIQIGRIKTIVVEVASKHICIISGIEIDLEIKNISGLSEILINFIKLKKIKLFCETVTLNKHEQRPELLAKW